MPLSCWEDRKNRNRKERRRAGVLQSQLESAQAILCRESTAWTSCHIYIYTHIHTDLCLHRIHITKSTVWFGYVMGRCCMFLLGRAGEGARLCVRPQGPGSS